MVTFPNAKINIGLNIERRRPDGYHELSTVFYPVPWRDILEIVPAAGSVTTLTVTGRKVECPEDKNLVMKAYRALDAKSPLPPVDIYLHKIIPDGAGLGGGSSDAAFTIKMLNEMFSLDHPASEMIEIAAGIGADCPFFIYNKPCYATGIGECLTPISLDLSDYTIAIIKPPVSISTKEAFSNIVPAISQHSLVESLNMPVTEWNALRVKNDFEPQAMNGHKEIREIKEFLLDSGAEYASMSGSGTAVFGLFKTKKSDTLSVLINDRFPGYDNTVGLLNL